MVASQNPYLACNVTVITNELLKLGGVNLL